MEALLIGVPVWVGIAFCISQSAMFSGLNLALLGISRLRLEVEAQSGNPDAIKTLFLRGIVVREAMSENQILITSID